MKRRLTISAALCAATFAATAVVVDSSYTIVLPDYERSGIGVELIRAVDVLKAALKEGAGLELKSTTAKSFKGGRAIYIGEAAAKRAGLVPPDMKDFSSVIAEKGGDIYVFGCDRAIHPGIGKNPRHMAPVPTLKAIARFMEDYMDVRFLAPGDVGTDIPKIEKVEVPDGTFSRNDPRLEYSVAPHGTALYDYASGLFGRGRYYSYGGHTYPKACPPSKYFKEHPEYFGLIGGKRIGSDEKNPTLCISNPAVQELLVEELKRRFDEGSDVVQLAQQDGWQFCECENCKAFGGPGAEYIGEKIWRLHRDIAERLLKERPGKIVHILCYSATLKPPQTFRKFPANVMIELCHVSPEQLAEWKNYEVPKGFTAYIYMWGGYQPLGYTPKRSWMRCRDFAKMMIDYGIHGVYRCGYGELFGMEGPQYWVFNHAIENPDLDVSKTVDEYCLRAFGPAAAPQMRTFYETLDRRLRGINLMEGGLDGGALRQTTSYRDAQIQAPMELFAFVYTPTVVKTMETALATAESLADTPKRKKRLELVRRPSARSASNSCARSSTTRRISDRSPRSMRRSSRRPRRARWRRCWTRSTSATPSLTTSVPKRAGGRARWTGGPRSSSSRESRGPSFTRTGGSWRRSVRRSAGTRRCCAKVACCRARTSRPTRWRARRRSLPPRTSRAANGRRPNGRIWPGCRWKRSSRRRGSRPWPDRTPSTWRWKATFPTLRRWTTSAATAPCGARRTAT